jgi:hypothetical protein
MKVEVDISEDEIKSAIERKLRVAIAQHADNYHTETHIRDTVKKYWNESVDKIVQEEIENLPAIRAKVVAALENKIKNQLTKVMKEK